MIYLERDRLYLEDLSESWFPITKRTRLLWLLRLFGGLIGAVIFGLVVWLFVGLVFVRLLVWLVFVGLFCGLFGEPALNQRFFGTPRWSWRGAHRGLVRGLVWLGGGLVFGLIVGLVVGRVVWLVFGLIVGMVFELLAIFREGLPEEGPIQELAVPNEGTWQSGRLGLFTLPGAAVLVGALAWFTDIGAERIGGVRFPGEAGLASLAAAIASLVVTMWLAQGTLFLAHWVFRFGLRLYGYAPFRLDRFLEYAAHRRLFLQRIGGGYRFVHDVVRKHFYDLRSTSR